MDQLQEQARRRWVDNMIMVDIQNRVVARARRHILDKFNRHAVGHYQTMRRELADVPFYTTYTHHPQMLDPHQYGDTRRRVHMIEHTYEMRVNEAWKHCLRKFPKALDRAWSEVRVDYPDHGMHRRSLHH